MNHLPDASTTWRRGSRALTLASLSLIAVIVVVLVIIWIRTDWAWSPVDDAGHVLALQSLMDRYGALGGMVAYAAEMVDIDRSWGLFRPSYWIYPSVFYLLPVGPAHLARLLMILIVIAGPLIHFRRSGINGVRLWMAGLLLVASASSLYVGLFLVSLQELSAMVFVSLGLLLPNRWVRFVSWSIAAWFKAPFAWLLVGQAVADWRRGNRKLAAANALVGVGTLGLAVIMARSGSYTARYGLDPFAIWSNLQRLIEPMNALLLLSLLWWLVVTRSRLAWTNDTIALGIGWAGYTAQLLPWGVTAYYMGPISFLFGLTMASMLHGERVPIRTGLLALTVPALAALILVVNPLSQGFAINGAMRTLQDCLATRPGTVSVLQGNVLYVTTSDEGPIRLQQNLTLVDPSWEGSIQLGVANPDGMSPGTDLLLNAGSPLDPAPTGTRLVCGNAWAQVYGP